MKNQKVFFRPIGDSGPLSVYWYPGPYGVAVECNKGSGVAWISPDGKLLGVEFDDVNHEADHQTLEAKNGLVVEIFVNKGKVKIKTRIAAKA